MIAAGEGPLLWRVVYNGQTNRMGGGWDAGPWHPDRDRVEHFAAWLRTLGHHVEVQNNRPPHARF